MFSAKGRALETQGLRSAWTRPTDGRYGTVVLMSFSLNDIEEYLLSGVNF